MTPADDVSDWSDKFDLKQTAECTSVRSSVHLYSLYNSAYLSAERSCSGLRKRVEAEASNIVVRIQITNTVSVSKHSIITAVQCDLQKEGKT